MKYMLQRSAIALACAFCIVSNANAALPDLVITSITSTSASLDIIYGIPVGGKVDAKVIVKNQGTAPSPAGKVGFYFSGNVTISASDADSGAKCDIPPLDAGASTTCSGNIPIPNLQNGEYYLGGLIDYDNVIVESNKNNNTKATSNTITIKNYTDYQCFFDWAENTAAPSLLNKSLITNVLGDISYRGPYSSGVFIGVMRLPSCSSSPCDLSVVGVGGIFGSNVTPLGGFSSLLSAARSQNCGGDKLVTFP